MNRLLQDLRIGIRGLLKAWGFTTVSVLILGLGIGATTTVFSLANALMFRPLNNVDGSDADLVRLYSHDRTERGGWRWFSYPNFRDIRARSDVFEDLAADTLEGVGLAEGASTRRLFAAFVSSNYFSMLRVRMARGRAFTPADEEPGAPPVVVVSHAYWMGTGSDPTLVGKTLRINARVCTVVGIAPEGFTGTMAVIAPPLWLPLSQLDGLEFLSSDGSTRRAVLLDRDNHQLGIVGRLKPGLTLASAGPRLEALAVALEQAYPVENRNLALVVQQNSRSGVGASPRRGPDPFSTTMVFALAMAMVLLLVSALNLANMMLARGGLRQREVAIRLAVGASRWSVVRLLLVEASILSFAGGLLGLWIAYAASRVMASTVTSLLPMLGIVFDPAPDARVLAATIGFCVFGTAVFGLGPALRLSRPDLASALKDKAGILSSGLGRGRRLVRHGLVVSQIALSLALLTAGGLFFTGALRASSANPGFSLEGGVIAALDASLAGYDETRTRDAFVRVLEQVRALPGVVSASLAHTTPYGERNFDRNVQPAGAAPGTRAVNAQYRVIGADYFRTLGVALVRGREFTPAEEDTATTAHPVIVDVEFARRMWPGQDPIGRQLQWAERPADQAAPVPLEVVGMVTSLRVKLFDPAPRAHVYEPSGGSFQPAMMLHVRTASTGSGAEAAMLQAIGAGIRAADPDLPVVALKTLREHRDAGYEVWIVNMGANLFGVFGVVALLVAGVGLYGVRAFLVGQRTKEFGIRMAIGATAADVMRLVVSEGARLIVVGLGIGLALSAVVSRVLAGWIYGVSAFEPAVVGATAVLLTAVMLLACYVPARHATAVQPMTALRNE